MEWSKVCCMRKQLCVLSFLSMVFITILLCSDILLHKIVDILGVGVSLSLFSDPISYAVSNIITECFGKFIAILMILSGLCIELFTGLGISFASGIANQFNHLYQQSFSVALGGLGGLAVCAALAGLLGYSVNTILLIQLKKVSLLNEFIVRAIIATFVGELIFVIVAYSLWLWGSPLRLSALVSMLMFSFIFKLFFAFVYSIIGSYVVRWVRPVEAKFI